MGKRNFFNWELKTNNCQHFIKNLVKNIQKKKKKFIIQPVIFMKSDLYILNIVTILYTLFYKNVLNFYFKINDNINYSNKIKQAILPELAEIKKLFPETFIIYNPISAK
jgi:hypothetical protein